MIKHFIKLLLLLTALLAVFAHAEENSTATSVAPATTSVTEAEEEKSWWQIRQQRNELFYPHNAHFDTMEQGGDACMLCHPFSKNNIHDEKLLAQLRTISNEPLEAICHDCHVDKLNAPSECRLCHSQPETIWPVDHNFDYKNNHTEDAQVDQESCNTCHKQISFCSDCHFKRNYSGDFSGEKVHKLGYKAMHGLDARIAPAECGGCHQASYCSDCHRRSR